MATLNTHDKKHLKSIGFSASDVQEIIKGAKKTKYYLLSDNGKMTAITEEEAIRRLGREEWLRGLGRSSFFVGTNRFGLSGERIRMETRIFS